jgi:hypothetical protein
MKSDRRTVRLASLLQIMIFIITAVLCTGFSLLAIYMRLKVIRSIVRLTQIMNTMSNTYAPTTVSLTHTHTHTGHACV